jgi:hypothetical protein
MVLLTTDGIGICHPVMVERGNQTPRHSVVLVLDINSDEKNFQLGESRWMENGEHWIE